MPRGRKIKVIKTQGRDLENVMSQNDYDRILRQAQQKGTYRDEMMLDALYRTGLRVSELQFFTVGEPQARLYSG